MSAQVCVVIGVGPNIGLAVAKRFARQGFDVALVARNRDALAAHVKEIGENGGRAFAFSADASDPASLRKALADIERQLGAPTALVYNACTVRLGPPDTLTAEALEASFKLDVVGALVASQAVLPDMRNKQRGTILFTGGGSAVEPEPDLVSIGIGKAGIRNLCFSLAKAYGPEGIHVATVTVCGWVKAGTKYDPDVIADKFWDLHCQPKGAFEREIVFD